MSDFRQGECGGAELRRRGAWAKLLAVTVVVATGCGGGAGDLPEVIEAYGLRVERDSLASQLRLLNFPDYLDPGLIGEFREQYGVRIVQDFFDTNEGMMARLRAGGAGAFDLIVGSDYAVGILIADGILEPLDPDLLPNRRHLHPRFTGLPYDAENRFSVPYQWGTTGIGVRTDRARGAAEQWATWGVLFDPAQEVGRFALLDDARESIGAALLYLGHSVNTTDPEALEAAEALLAQTRERAAAFTPATTGRDLLVAGELDLSHNHSGDIGVAMEERGDVVYLIPREGAVMWADNLLIPAGSRAAYTAHVFMNFILDPANGARLTNFTRYASPNADAWGGLDAELREAMEEVLEGEGLDRLEFIEDQGEGRRAFDRLWTRVKAGGGR
jgi:spermidine/putrescine transport system substrate-binding protein